MQILTPTQKSPLQSSLQSLHRSIDFFSEITGRFLAWLGLLMMLILCVVVALRYGLGIGAVAMQEAVTYLHGCLFMLGAAYTLKHDGHVRVDIFYRYFSDRQKAWINSLGAIIFVLPLCGYIFIISSDFVLQSWRILEVSTEPGGIPAVFLLKTLIPLLSICLGLQALAEVLRNTLILIHCNETAD